MKASLRDVLLLVAGILIAFWLDASWDERQQRASDAAQLAALSDEFGDVIEGLLRDSADIALQLESTRAVMTLMHAPDGVSQDEVLSALRPLLTARTLQVPSGAYTVLAQTGVLGRLADGELRGLLGAWPARFADTAEGGEWLREHRDDELMPLLNEFVPLSDLSHDTGPTSRFPHRVESLLASRRFLGLLAYREQVAENSAGEMAELLRVARRIRALLENRSDTV